MTERRDSERDAIVSRLSRSIAVRVAIVTGAASGMGRATAALFAAEGALVAALDLNEAGLASLVAESPGTIVAFACDVSDDSAITATVDAVRRALGPIDILINNAGPPPPRPTTMPSFRRRGTRPSPSILTGADALRARVSRRSAPQR
jgi:NAD(P)-dependent dehydrogenase (short-subunit alcohol dehydrogenase family)